VVRRKKHSYRRGEGSGRKHGSPSKGSKKGIGITVCEEKNAGGEKSPGGQQSKGSGNKKKGRAVTEGGGATKRES